MLLDLMFLLEAPNSYLPQGGGGEWEMREGIPMWGGRNSTGGLESSFCLCQMG